MYRLVSCFLFPCALLYYNGICMRVCVCVFTSISGDNLDKQLMRYQRRRKGQVVQPFQGEVSDHLHSQEAASALPLSEQGKTPAYGP